jgi:predicted short-subunit dehydrogenase-like oxidoreductase (DUF2520 family)
MLTLNIIGCGKVGGTIGKALIAKRLVHRICILNRSFASAERARAFVGDGIAADDFSQLPAATLWMVATPDSAFPDIASSLSTCSTLQPNTIVFHCSGASDSSVFDKLRDRNVHCASIHPIRSFADPEIAYSTFSETICSLEGDVEACAVLKPLFEKVGTSIFEISKDAKVLSHIGHVFASNYLVTILDLAQRLYITAGIPEPLFTSFMKLLAHSALTNVTALGTTHALTGPISRGEADTISKHLQALESLPDASLRAAYLSLARAALEITLRREHTNISTTQELTRLLRAS